MRLAQLSSHDRQLVEDVNYYNFLRTYRMEIKIRAQYLSIPLFREIERRAIADGKLLSDQIFLMVPPEAVKYLRTGDVPHDLAERESAWALTTEVEGAKWQVLAGTSYEEFSLRFYSVIHWNENARGVHSPTASFIGGKGVGLFGLLGAGCEPPPFFIVTTHAFEEFIKANGLGPDLTQRLREASTADSSDVSRISEQIRELIEDSDIPAGIVEAIRGSAQELGVQPLAVRSSATVEDALAQSWAGRFESVLHVDAVGLLDAVRHVWASLFSVSAILYAQDIGVDLANAAMAVVVQAMVPAEVSGVMNTVLDSGHPNIVELEVAFGFGTALVNGEVSPDTFHVDLGGTPTIMAREIKSQARRAGVAGWEELGPDERDAAKLTDDQILAVAELGKRLERDLGCPQDVEFAVAGAKVYVVQSRPQTALTGEAGAVPSTRSSLPATARLVASGLKGKTAGIHQGTAQILFDLNQASNFETGNILVLQAATPAWDAVIFRASALITNEGGATSHAIRVANERGIPAVVGTAVATDVIPGGSQLLLDTEGDPFKGKVYVL